MNSANDPWEERYRKGEDEWDKGSPSPGLVDFLKQLSPDIRRGRVVNPGCGRGHDTRAFAHHGFDALGMDIAETAIRDARAVTQTGTGSAHFVRTDFFSLDPKWEGQFDWFFEHTFFCAIDPSRRDPYVEQVLKLLKPDGYFLAVFYNIQPDDGPPFGTSRQELQQRFLPHFDLLMDIVPRSYPNRTGLELLWWMRRKVHRE